MKERTKYFLAEDKIDHDGEVFDYIRELHDYLWQFVYLSLPDAGGCLSDYVDDALKKCKPFIERTERERILVWGIEPCMEHGTGGGICSRRECPKCWIGLKESK